MRDEAADCLQRHFVTVTAEEDARRREFDARVAKATGRTYTKSKELCRQAERLRSRLWGRPAT
jgi:hypothetical protein